MFTHVRVARGETIAGPIRLQLATITHHPSVVVSTRSKRASIERSIGINCAARATPWSGTPLSKRFRQCLADHFADVGREPAEQHLQGRQFRWVTG